MRCPNFSILVRRLEAGMYRMVLFGELVADIFRDSCTKAGQTDPA